MHPAASPDRAAAKAQPLSDTEKQVYDLSLRQLARWYPHAPAALAHQAAFLLAADRSCSDALLITADSFRLYAAEFPQNSISACNHTLDLARHLEMAAPERARRCA